MNGEYYHTQEKRRLRLLEPIPCKKDNAWLGEALYFWWEEDDAVFWGINSKKKTGEYEIYKSEIHSEDILDTVFNKEHYEFWLTQINKAAKHFIKKTLNKPTLKEINEFFKEKGIWDEVDGILFQDISQNPDHYLVDGMQYKKRIQLAVYKNQIIRSFEFHFDGQCI